MNLIVFAVMVLVVAGILAYVVGLLPLAHPFNRFAQVLILLVAALVIAQRAGLL